MSNAFFFGYGSLVNRATHVFDDAHPAQIMGWARTWRQTAARDVAFLTAVPEATSSIQGLVAAVPAGDWPALDEREQGYDRLPARDVTHPVSREIDVQIYAIPGADAANDTTHPILLSYLDVVVQGYLREFGQPGAEAFFETTHGWDTPILNDRAAPRYPRAQVLAPRERDMVDQILRDLSAVVIERQ